MVFIEMTDRLNILAQTLMIRFPLDLTLWAPPAPRTKFSCKDPFCPQPISLLAHDRSHHVFVPDGVALCPSVSLSIAGHTFIDDTEFVEVQIYDEYEDTTPHAPQSSLSSVRVLFSGVVNFIKGFFTAGKTNTY